MKYISMVVLLVMLLAGGVVGGEVLNIRVGGEERIGYQARPISNPVGGEYFRGSNFIHPLRTPSGFVVTCIQPGDHKHHFGVWWPWKYIETAGRKVLFWELQNRKGIIEARESEETPNGFTALSVYLDRTAPGGTPVVIINERLNATVSDLVEVPARGYFLDLEIIHENITGAPLVISQYRYSGFSIRGTADWTCDNSVVQTSEGRDRDSSNGTPGRWVRVEGTAVGEARAGLVMMSHPSNLNHPERLRTWDSRQHKGAVFINFNPVQDGSATIELGASQVRCYRLFVYDGTVTDEQAEALWQAYSR